MSAHEDATTTSESLSPLTTHKGKHPVQTVRAWYRKAKALEAVAAKRRAESRVYYIRVGLELLANYRVRGYSASLGIENRGCDVCRNMARAWQRHLDRLDSPRPLSLKNLPTEWEEMSNLEVEALGQATDRAAHNTGKKLHNGHYAEATNEADTDDANAAETDDAALASEEDQAHTSRPWSASDPVDAWSALPKIFAAAKDKVATVVAAVEGWDEKNALQEEGARLARVLAAGLDAAVQKAKADKAKAERDSGDMEDDHDEGPVYETDEERQSDRASLAEVAPPWDLTSVASDLTAAPDLTRLPPRVRRWLSTQKMVSLPTPTRHVGTTRGQGREDGREYRPTLPNLCDGCPPPDLYEPLMGLPHLYSDPNHELVVSRRPEQGTATVRVISVCSGIGCSDYGLALAAHDSGVAIQFLAAVEVDEFAASLHQARFPDTEVLGNLRSPWVLGRLGELAGPTGIDLLLLTLPCPPYSRARTAAGGSGADHAQWLEPWAAVDATRPKVVIYENVAGILDHGGKNIRLVVEGFRSRGYVVRLRVVEAAEFGALHERARVILIAWRSDLAAAEFDAPTEPRPETLTEDEWLRAPLSDDLFLATSDRTERLRSMAIGGGVCVPVARAAGRFAFQVILGTVPSEADRLPAETAPPAVEPLLGAAEVDVPAPAPTVGRRAPSPVAPPLTKKDYPIGTRLQCVESGTFRVVAGGTLATAAVQAGAVGEVIDHAFLGGDIVGLRVQVGETALLLLAADVGPGRAWQVVGAGRSGPTNPRAASTSTSSPIVPTVVADGRARLLYGVDVLDGLRAVSDGSVSCVVTSPPYYGVDSVDYGHPGQWGKEASFDEYLDHFASLGAELRRVLEPGGSVWLNFGDVTGADNGFQLVGEQVVLRLREVGWYIVNVVTWVKTNAKPNARYRLQPTTERIILLAREGEVPTLDVRSTGRAPCPETIRKRVEKLGWPKADAESLRVVPPDVFFLPTSGAVDGQHPAAFPPALAERCITVGCRPGCTVLDPFSGSASTGVASLELGRQFVGIDIQQDYLDLAVRSLKAVRIASAAAK